MSEHENATSMPDPEGAVAPEVSHEDEHRAQHLSMQCWRVGQRARTAEDWTRAVEHGREATRLFPPAPEPHFNLAVALTGLARTGQDAEARAEAVRVFDHGLALTPDAAQLQYASTAVGLLEKRGADLGAEPAYQYALGRHLAALGRTVKARRALTAASADPTIGARAAEVLASVPEPVVARAPAVGRNDPCPCGSGKKYKKCHGAAA